MAANVRLGATATKQAIARRKKDAARAFQGAGRACSKGLSNAHDWANGDLWHGIRLLDPCVTPRHVPSHLLDERNVEKKRADEEAGGDLELLKGNEQADILADHGAELQATPDKFRRRATVSAAAAKVAQQMYVPHRGIHEWRLLW